MVEYGTTIDLEGFGLEVGTPSVKSVGSLAFGPEGILFIGDNVGAAIFAIDVADADVGTGPQAVNLENFDASLAAYLGCSREDVSIIDMAVHPKSDNLYFSVMRGSGRRGRSRDYQGQRQRGNQRCFPGKRSLLPDHHQGRR